MRISTEPPVHLTYCMNVHPGETWAQNMAAIRDMALAVRDRVCRDQPFGLGLRLSNAASLSLSEPSARNEFKTFLDEHSLYVFTVNAFPYGAFHDTRVKEQVYLPDWRESARRDYTIRVADILANLLPDSVSGSISTVPCSYRQWMRTREDTDAVVRNLMDTVIHLSNIERETGKTVHVGLEPEPDCYLETTNDIIHFFETVLDDHGCRYVRERTGCDAVRAKNMIRRHLGVCFDACHLSLQFEDLAESLARIGEHGIRLSKIHVSGAIRAVYSDDFSKQLSEFEDDVYLHQVKIRSASGDIVSYPDLSDALSGASERDGTEWRVHCHVPLYFTGAGEIGSTAEELTEAFFRIAITLGVEHLEIETYTFNVLPERIRGKGLVASIADEYRWVLDRCAVS
ncbi:MAG: hypothetical protein E4H02_02945 [Lentisphaerales bacterium]|nr:MAG: hypothetical protein E4H02_02945 [Lentisphaerales bacterium]